LFAAAWNAAFFCVKIPRRAALSLKGEAIGNSSAGRTFCSGLPNMIEFVLRNVDVGTSLFGGKENEKDHPVHSLWPIIMI